MTNNWGKIRKENALDSFSHTLNLIDEQIKNLDSIERGNVELTVEAQAGKIALLDLKRRMEEDQAIGRQLLAV